MNNIKALEYMRANQSRFMSMLNPLMENSPVTGFVYMELWGDSNFFLMGSDPRWMDEYLMRGSPGLTWVEGLKFAATQDKPTHVFWSLLESEDPIEQYCVDLGYRYGMNIYKREENKIRLWGFNGFDPASLFYFQSQKDFLEQFTFYFQEKCGDLFTEERLKSNAASWVTPLELGLNSTTNISDVSSPNFDLFQPRRVILPNKKRMVSLTFRQWEILKQYSRGSTMKETGRLLDISPRTVESVLDAIKEKTGILSREALIQLVKKNTYS